MSLQELGWTPEDAARFASAFDEPLEPARVVRTAKHVYHIVCREGRMIGRVSGGFRHRNSCGADFPAVGDWVAVKPRPGTEEMNIHGVLERRSAISRQAIGGSGRGRKIEEQVLAANIDIAFLVAALDGERGFNLRRLERYLTLAHKGGVEPVVVLNKADLCEDPESVLDGADIALDGVDVILVSAEAGDGLDGLAGRIGAGRSVVFLGPSGVGKSSIINCLLGEEQLAVGAVRDSDARGKHTTTWSEISVLPGGGVLIDTPGMREILLWSDEESVGETFPEIRDLARECKFSDCGHGSEPGCAVRVALEAGKLDPERFHSFIGLRDEVKSAKTQVDQTSSKREGTRITRVRREKRRRWTKS